MHCSTDVQEFLREQGLQEARACYCVTQLTRALEFLCSNEFNRRNRLLAGIFRAKLRNEIRRLMGTDEGDSDTPAVRACM